MKVAAKLGSVQAHYKLAFSYRDGDWGLKKNIEKIFHHYKVAALWGHPLARHSLGCLEYDGRRFGRALRHWMLSVKMGHEISLKYILKFHKMRFATKDDYAQALLEYQNVTKRWRATKETKQKTGLWIKCKISERTSNLFSISCLFHGLLPEINLPKMWWSWTRRAFYRVGDLRPSDRLKFRTRRPGPVLTQKCSRRCVCSAPGRCGQPCCRRRQTGGRYGAGSAGHQ